MNVVRSYATGLNQYVVERDRNDDCTSGLFNDCLLTVGVVTGVVTPTLIASPTLLFASHSTMYMVSVALSLLKILSGMGECGGFENGHDQLYGIDPTGMVRPVALECFFYHNHEQ